MFQFHSNKLLRNITAVRLRQLMCRSGLTPGRSLRLLILYLVVLENKNVNGYPVGMVNSFSLSSFSPCVFYFDFILFRVRIRVRAKRKLGLRG